MNLLAFIVLASLTISVTLGESLAPDTTDPALSTKDFYLYINFSKAPFKRQGRVSGSVDVTLKGNDFEKNIQLDEIELNRIARNSIPLEITLDVPRSEVSSVTVKFITEIEESELTLKQVILVPRSNRWRKKVAGSCATFIDENLHANEELTRRFYPCQVKIPKGY